MQVFPLPMPTGYRHDPSVCIYLAQTDHHTYLIDTSTHFANHAEVLRDKLRERGVDSIDRLLLTHFHSDHSGNAGVVKQWFPEAQIVIHHQGADRLRKGSDRWYGEKEPQIRRFFRRYGKPRRDDEPVFPSWNRGEHPVTLPAEPDVLMTEETVLDDEVEVIFTPGHSMDHICYGIHGHFFGGDTVLTFIPGLEDLWAGYENTCEALLQTAKRLNTVSERYPHVHAFHRDDLPSLAAWYGKLIVPKMVKKYHQLITVLDPKQPKTLHQVMEKVYPQWPGHYIYLSQFMGLLEFLVQERQIQCHETEDGAWNFTLPSSQPDADFMTNYLL